MIGLLIASLLACSSPKTVAREAANERCESVFHSGSSRNACKEGVRYHWNGNNVERSKYYCNRLQPIEVQACYYGVSTYNQEFKKTGLFSKKVGEGQSLEESINESSSSTAKVIEGFDHSESVESSSHSKSI